MKKVVFIDGTEKEFDKATEFDESDNFIILRDEEEDEVVRVNISQIKYIE